MNDFTVKHYTTTLNKEAKTMKTPTKQTAHRLATVLSLATALATTGAWANLTIDDTRVYDADWSDTGYIALGSVNDGKGIVTNNYDGAVTVGSNFIVAWRGSNAYGEYIQNKGSVTVGE